jgi:hypothetical protein
MDELRVPLDSEGFSRRECPRCGAHFKLRWSSQEASLLAAALTRRYPHDEQPPACERRHCPYCAAAAAADEFFTDDVQRRLDLEASKVERAVRQRRLAVPAEWLAANPRATAPREGRDAPRLPLRPDPDDDLLCVALPCCGDEQKVSEAWVGPIRCHRCGIAHLRAGPRDIGVELALLREWASTDS